MNMMPITRAVRNCPKSVVLDTPTPLIKRRRQRRILVYGLVGLKTDQRVYQMEFSRVDQ
jgi:hypothetical protein